MRWIVLLGIGVLVSSACRSHRPDGGAAAVERESVWTEGADGGTAGGGRDGEAVIFPITSGDGVVARVNRPLRFVVLDFPLHPLPAVGQQMFLYRRGQKVARVKVTGPFRGRTVAADIVEGVAEVGDEVRAD